MGLSGQVVAVAASGIGIDSTTSFLGRTGDAFNGYHYVSWNEIGADVGCLFVGFGGNGIYSGLDVRIFD